MEPKRRMQKEHNPRRVTWDDRGGWTVQPTWSLHMDGGGYEYRVRYEARGLVTARDAARALGVHARTVLRWIAAGTLTFVVKRGVQHVPHSSLRRMLQAEQKGGTR